MHSLHVRNGTLESHRLPLLQSSSSSSTSNRDEEGDTNAVIELVQTPLPDIVRQALEVDPPLELLCVEGNGVIPSSRNRRNNTRNKDVVPQQQFLCLYTAKSIFFLTLSLDKENAVNGMVQGVVDSITEPFERLLLGSFGTSILRVRAAPQQQQYQQHNRNGYATLCPAQSVAVLTYNDDCHEYSLHLWHASQQQITTPLVFGMEQVDDDDRVVDFCFARSKGLSLLSTLSVLFLKASSDLLAASPVCFDGAVVPRAFYQEAMQYLTDQLGTCPHTSAKWRQCRIAQQYLLDVFGRPGTGFFVTARLLPTVSCPPSTAWPVQIQGTVLFASGTDGALPSAAMVLEPFGSSECVSVAVGREDGVDVAVISPTSVLPRFTLESNRDANELDDALFRASAWVERIAFSNVVATSTSPPPTCSVSLVEDPLDTILHCVTSKFVATVSTNAVVAAHRRLEGQRALAIRTKAWSSLTATGSSLVQGVVVDTSTNDHDLVVRLVDGSMIPVSVSDTLLRHEIQEALLAPPPSSSESTPLRLTDGSNSSSSIGNASSQNDGSAQELLDSLQSSPPLYELMNPLVQKLQEGLASMTKVVGTATSYQDITPDQLAVALAMFERCDHDVVMPLLELKRLVKKRRERLKAVMQKQAEQVAALQKTVQTLKGGFSTIGETLERVESNAATLSQRSAAALAASQSLAPTVSRAEVEYFNDVKRLANTTTKLEEKAKRVVDSAKNAQAKLASGLLSLNLTEEDTRSAIVMLDDQGKTIQETQQLLGKSQELLTDLTTSLNLNYP